MKIPVLRPVLPTVYRFCSHILVAVFICAAIVGCNSSEPEVEYIARVGDRLLTHDDLNVSFDPHMAGQDSNEALNQIVEEWVKNELIAQEAIRRGLRNDSEVKRLLAENERSVLVSTFLSRLFQEEPLDPTEEELEAYYAQHADQLALREDYLRVRYISTQEAAQANQVRTRLRDATVAGKADSLWPALVNQFAINPETSINISSRFYPKSLLFPSAVLKQAIDRLSLSQISPVIEEGNAYHVVQIAEVRQSGTVPDLEWIEDELTQRLTIESRKQMVARQVQRLRTEAMAREDLEISYKDE